MKGRVLIVAGSDSGGGAGIQADIKTVTALEGYAATAVTALTAQDTQGVHGVHAVPVSFIQEQMRLVLADIGADCIKTGMLHSAEVIDGVCDVIEAAAPDTPVVVDPVMIAKGGAALLDPTATATLKRRIALIATLLTPNIPEAEALSGMRIRSVEDMRDAGASLLTLGCRAVLLKGGHLAGERLYNVLVTGNGIETFEAPRIRTEHTHGTGCSLASAIATGIAQGLALRDAVARGLAYVHAAIRQAPGFGHGHGPIDHAHTVRPFTGR
ncbi:MAG: bifunctional hydroxymethylpyrimidine kinase/phosphomethylpyrimidine kinase [Alphaproteobacteria bacterium]|nr:bifunctional hydroxymethylpyrimidine kinase/phosphomethylpyrimidine kinase [Alphaproteobacteria bacterium]